jgi:RHS repeat-associated protein
MDRTYIAKEGGEMDSITIRGARRDVRATATTCLRSAVLSAAWLVASGAAPPATAAVGRTAGIAGVTSNGEASYVIAIRATPGIAGLTPDLAISYGAAEARGILGAGFTLSGLSAITPCPRTIAQDGEAAPVMLTTADVYCVDGQRLRLVAGTYGANNAQYRTEIDRAMRVTSFGVAGKQPTWFRIERSNGLIYQYGNTADSRARSSTSATAVTFIWALNRISDRNGNSIVVRYENDADTGLFRPNYIDYTATTAGPAQHRIDFVYQTLDRPDPIEASTSSSAEPATLAEKRLLSRIDLRYQGERYRRYLLNYETGSNRTSRLVSIQECAGASSECFEPTQFTWQSSLPGYDAPIASGATVTLPAWPIDYNGDGYDDLVWAQAGTWRTMTGSAGGYGAAVNTGTAAINPAAAIPLEWNGDGRDDLLVQSSDSTWRVLRGTANGLAAPVAAGAGGVSSDTTSSWTAVDLDGDGRDDLVRAIANARRFSSQLNSATGFTSEGVTTLGFTLSPAADAFPASTYGTTDTRRVDFDDDGREDLAIQGCQYDFETSKCMTATGWWTFRSNGSRLIPQGMLYSSVGGGSPVFGDFNADRLTDVVYARADGVIAVALSRGGAGFAYVPGPSTAGYAASDLRVADYDGDGYDDLLMASSPAAGASRWHLFRGTGTGLASTPVATTVPGLGSLVTDVTGDGLADLARAGAGNSWSVYPRLGVPGDLLQEATDGFGVTAEWTRTPMSSTAVYQRGSGAVYPVSDVGGSRPLVSSLRQSDGSGTSATFTLSFEYEAFRLHRQGRGRLGFEARTTHDDRLNYDLKHRETYLQTYPHIGLSATQTLRRRDGSLVSDAVNTWSSVVSGAPLVNERRLPFLAGVVQRDYSSAGSLFRTTRRSVVSIDPTSGVPLDQTTTVTENATGIAPGSSRTVRVLHTGLVNDSASWCLGRPTATQATTSHTTAGGAAITRSVAQTWDTAKCRVAQQQLQPGDAKLQVTRTLAYDEFGNVASEKIAGIGMAARTTSLDWGTTGQFPESMTNALSQTSILTWDPAFGVPLTARDPNLLTTTWSYDALGRLVSELRPDQTSTTWSRTECVACDPRTKYQLTQSEVGESGVVSWSATRAVDRYERDWRVASELPGGGESITAVEFDAKGRLITRRLPVVLGGADAGQWRYSYDESDQVRLEQLRRPGGSIDRSIAYEYDGLQVTVTDPLGHATIATSSAWGDIVRVTDAANRTMAYQYNASGQPTRVVDSSGNQLISIAYNARGMKTSQTDMDLGAWTIESNALGEVVRFRDARTPGPGWTAVNTYDVLGRLTSREDVAEGVKSTFVHGSSAAAHNIGRLQSTSLSDGSYTESYTYDAAARLARRRIVAGGTYDYNYAYDVEGRLKSLQYPVSTGGYRFTVGLQYSHGQLAKILDSSSGTPIWELTTSDAAGRAIDARLGTGIQVLNGFDETTGKLESRRASAGATTLQDLEYQWDDADRLLSRADQAQSGLTETFAYDELNRLDRSWRNGVLNLDVAYDELGNITSKFETGLGTYTYKYDASRKHAVISAGPNAYAYDANGNMQSRNGAGTSWYSFNLPNVIGQSGGESSRLWYGPDRQRWKQVATQSGTTETTLYVGGLLEKLTKDGVTTWRHYVPTPSGATALYLRKSAGSPAAALHYVLTDHLGSTDKIVDATGSSITVAESFSAFGRRRGRAWSGAPTAPELAAIAATTRDGYTGHESVDSVALVHMNGRVYDPLIGRFLSADPYVTAPFDPDGWNRYAYVGSNPTSLVDPSGFSAADGDDRPPILCDDGCVAWYLADFAYGYVPSAPPVFYGYPRVGPGSSGVPVPPQPPSVVKERRIAPSMSIFSGLPSDSLGATGCARAGRCSHRSLPDVTFDDFVNFVAGAGDVLLATGTLSIADGAEYRRVRDVGSVDLHSKAYQTGFWGTVFATAGVARAFVKPPAAAPVANPAVGEFAASSSSGRITALSEIRYTQPGEAFIRYESGNAAFSRITSRGGVTPGTFAAPTSDGLVPALQRTRTYNLPSPAIPRPNHVILEPPAGTLVIGPRPVMGGTGNEVLFPQGF